MFATTTKTLAFSALAALLPSIQAAHFGGVAIYNDCSFPVYSHNVIQGAQQKNPATILPGHWYWTPYKNPDQGAVSVKLGKAHDLSGRDPITQLEYNIEGNIIYYDISNVDCGPHSGSHPLSQCPFIDGGMFLHADNDCPTKRCKSGDSYCHEAYNQPDDNWAMGACGFQNKNLVMYLCRSTRLDGTS